MTRIASVLTTVALTSIVPLSFSSVAQAQQVAGSIGFTGVGSVSFTGPNLGSAITLDFPDINIVNIVDPTYNMGGPAIPNDFFVLPLLVNLSSAVTIAPDPLDTTTPTPFSVDFTTAAGPATFTGTSFFSASAVSNALDISYEGILTGTGFQPTNAQLSLAFTNTGNVNYSGTLATIPNDPNPPGQESVPEPGTIISLLVVGAAGVASRRRHS